MDSAQTPTREQWGAILNVCNEIICGHSSVRILIVHGISHLSRWLSLYSEELRAISDALKVARTMLAENWFSFVLPTNTDGVL